MFSEELVKEDSYGLKHAADTSGEVLAPLADQRVVTTRKSIRLERKIAAQLLARGGQQGQENRGEHRNDEKAIASRWRAQGGLQKPKAISTVLLVAEVLLVREASPVQAKHVFFLSIFYFQYSGSPQKEVTIILNVQKAYTKTKICCSPLWIGHPVFLLSTL